MQNTSQELFIWIPLIGFEKNDADRGAARLLQQMKHKPDAMSLFLFHPDIVHQHSGMSENHFLHPDNCSYYANARNDERERQQWSSWELRELVQALHQNKVETYLGIMGSVLNDSFHQEWAVHEHPEVRGVYPTGKGRIHIFKRLQDGSYYEDFFADKLCRTLTDYGFDGVHTADGFWGDTSEFSFDCFSQFVDHTGIKAPSLLLQAENSPELLEQRGEWLWNGYWLPWINFWALRGQQFWSKVNHRLHAIGKKSIVLEMYCTDPFETLFRKGSDLQLLQEAGIDYHMANPAGTGLKIEGFECDYHQHISMIALTRALLPDAKIVSMLGVRDCTEEWDTLHHVPCRLERDIYMHQLYTMNSPDGLERCMRGFLVCLGDGIRTEEWKWLHERFPIGAPDNLLQSISPTLVCSAHEFASLPEEYMRNLRWPLSRWYYRICGAGVLPGNVLNSDHLDLASGTLFVPNFDLFSVSEQQQLLEYRKGAVIAIAAAEFHPEKLGLHPDFQLVDGFSTTPMRLYAWNLGRYDCADLSRMAAQDDGLPNISAVGLPPLHKRNRLLVSTLPYAKVSNGFLQACARLLQEAGAPPLLCDLPMNIMQTKTGSYRISILNPDDDQYHFAKITCQYPVESVKILSKYPVLPVKFQFPGVEKSRFLSQDNTGDLRVFKVRLAPGGMSILEVFLVDSGNWEWS